MKESKKADVIIVGTGAAGLYTALKLSKSIRVFMITKDEILNSDSYLAQGGISVLKGREDYESYYEDTLKAGRYENNKQSVEVMINTSPYIMKDLIHYGVDFDKEGEEYSYTREGAHSTYRILHHKDITGKEITTKLLNNVLQCDNITILPHTTMLDLLQENNKCNGIIVQTEGKEIEVIRAKIVILATGGIGGLFHNSTNFLHITGDGIALSLKYKIKLENIHYIQIHPTTLYSENPGRRFLISESVRGEGGYLYNRKKERFVDELLPRDMVSSAIKMQMRKEDSTFVYLSMKHLDAEKVRLRFPNIYEKCLEEGYDLTKDFIPVTPAQHYHMGGIKVDLNSNTSMQNLFAVGEVSCNGVHGKNRLASNSLLESLVFAERAANVVNQKIHNILFEEEQLLNLDRYYNIQKIQKENKQMILREIRRKDEKFYDEWCDHAD